LLLERTGMETAGQEDGARRASLLDLGLAALNLPGCARSGFRAFELVTSDVVSTESLSATSSVGTAATRADLTGWPQRRVTPATSRTTWGYLEPFCPYGHAVRMVAVARGQGKVTCGYFRGIPLPSSMHGTPSPPQPQ
jgi:hypothetical protein